MSICARVAYWWMLLHAGGLVSRSLILSVVFLLLFSFAVLIVPASAAALTVGPSEQYKTITDAVNAAQPGDTITVSPGTYTENVVVAKSLTITALRADSPPTVKAADQDKDVFRVQGKGVHITGLTIVGASNASACMSITPRGA